ncbi:MAG: histidinol phosphate phosphatase domain-containing protein [Anaerolineales bacterium]
MNKIKRIDFHTHSFFSDGVLLPSELLRRVSALGYEALAITDHVDASNMDFVLDGLLRLQRQQSEDFATKLVVGVELTHVAPESIDRLARRAKDCGAEIVVVHGETIVEPVAPGTNEAAVTSSAVDILAHPGFLTLEEARAAVERDCFIEITTRRGHSLTNGHVARICQRAGAKMLVNTDAHAPDDLVTVEFATQVARGAGLREQEILSALYTNPHALLSRIGTGRT